jgi:hypothetical protein
MRVGFPSSATSTWRSTNLNSDTAYGGRFKAFAALLLFASIIGGLWAAYNAGRGDRSMADTED